MGSRTTLFSTQHHDVFVGQRRATALLVGLLTICLATACDQLQYINDANQRCSWRFTAVSGDGQTGEVLTTLAADLVLDVRVTPGTGRCSDQPAVNERIGWTTTSGSVPSSTITDASGRTTVRWTLGPQLGAQSVTAAISDNSTAQVLASFNFNATAVSKPYRALRKVTGDAQTALTGQLLAIPPEVVLMLVRDAGPQLGRRDSAIEFGFVDWTITSGGGLTNPTRSVTIANGHTFAQWRLGPTLGTQTLQATAQSAAAPPDPRDTLQLLFTAIAGNVPVASVNLTPPDTTIYVGESYQLTATLKDAQGTILTGRPVTYRSRNPAVATVSNGGLVTGSTAGVDTVEATSEGITGTARATVVNPPATARIAYAAVDAGGAVVGASDFNSTLQSITAARTGTGTYRVTFGGQATPAGQQDVILVSSYGIGSSFCKLLSSSVSGGNMTAEVRCYDPLASPTGGPRDGGFTIVLLDSTTLPGRFAFGTVSSGILIASFNSSLQPIQVSSNAVGVYSVTFNGNARPAGGRPEALLITAAGGGNPRCSVGNPLSGASVQVYCWDSSVFATPPNIDAGFSVALVERGRTGQPYGVAFVRKSRVPATRTIVPDSAYAPGGTVVTQRTTAGRETITFSGLGRTSAGQRETVLVGGLEDTDGSYCKVEDWQTAGADLRVTVQCYHEEGDPDDLSFYLLVLR